MNVAGKREKRKKKRGATRIIHQKLALEIEFEHERLVGYTDIVCLPHSSSLKQINVNASQLQILQVLVNGLPTTHHTLEPLTTYRSQTGAGTSGDRIGLEHVRDLECLELAQNQALDIATHGEVSVMLPEAVQESLKAAELSIRDPKSPQSIDQGDSLDDLMPAVVIRIYYILSHPTAGLHFTTPQQELPDRPHQVFTTSAFGTASCWFPCHDTANDRCTYDLELTCPAGYTVVASGELQQQVFTDATESKVTFEYKLPVPTMARQLGFVCARMHILPDPAEDVATHFVAWRSSGGDHATDKRVLEQLKHTTACTSAVFHTYENYLAAPYPYESYKQVFVDDAYFDAMSFAGVAVLSTSLLYGKEMIDQAFVTRERLAGTLALSWTSTLCIASFADWWMVEGIARFFTSLYIQDSFGVNEAEYARMMDCLKVTECDVLPDQKQCVPEGSLDHVDGDGHLLLGGDLDPAKTAVDSKQVAPADHFYKTRPLCWEGYAHSSEIYSELMSKKAGIVCKMLKNVIGVPNFNTLIKNTLKKSGAHFQNHETQELAVTSTHRLIKEAQEISNEVQALDAFSRHWILCDGYPSVTCSFTFSKKKKLTELRVEQQTNDSKSSSSSSSSSAAGARFTGHLLFRIHEKDRAWESVKRIDEDKATFEFPCNSRLTRNRKRKRVQEETLAIDELLQRYIETPVLWVRIDPHYMWLRPFVVSQEEVMWILQMKRERDVVAQYEAVQGLARTSKNGTELLSFNALDETLRNKKVFHRIRAAAAYALAKACEMNPASSERNLRKLLDYFHELTHAIGHNEPSLLPNDFSDFADYYLKKLLPLAMSQMLEPGTQFTPRKVYQVLLRLLETNDNSKNAYSDSFYLYAILRAAGRLKVENTSERACMEWCGVGLAVVLRYF